MEAKEFLKGCIKDKAFKEAVDLIDNAIIIDVMEAYHQSRVNAISDEEIEKEFKYDNTNDSVIGAKWFKEQLLKQ